MSIGYRQLAERLQAGIARGDFKPGDTLPRQEDLAAEHGVTVTTVRRAIAVLEAAGLVTPIRRRGTVVRERPVMRRLGAERYAKSKWKFGLVAFAADREASGRSWKPTDQTNAVRKTEADAEVADALGIELGSEVYERARLVKDGDTPTHTLTSYYRPEHVANTPLVDPTPGPASRGGGFAVLTLQGLEPDHITETLNARMPTQDEVEQLNLPAGEPVVVLRRITMTRENVPVEFARGIHAASRFAWSYSFKIPD